MKGLLVAGIAETERTYEKHRKNISSSSSLMSFLSILDDDDE